MPLFSIDETLCKKDGICAEECPMAIISWKKGTFPTPGRQADSLCINCGHCVAVCPHGAMKLKKLSPEDCLPVDRQMALSPEKTEHFLRSRRSIRAYKQAPLEKETLSELIRIASFAPSGHNLQPVSWRVISGRENVKSHTAMVIDWMKSVKEEDPKLAQFLHLEMLINAWEADIDAVTRNAPTLILAQGSGKDITASTACTIAMTYLDLAAQSFGVGTCWCGYFLRAANVYGPLAQRLGQGEGIKTYAVMMAGYPKFAYHRMPLRNTPDITWSE